MNRRHAVKNVLGVAAGWITLPLWMQSCNYPGSDAGSHFSGFSPKEQIILAGVADAIIPAGTAIGALAVGVDKYLQKIFDDCYEQPVQDNIKQQLLALDESARNQFGKSFGECPLTQRQELLNGFQKSTEKPKKDFFDLLKSETIQGFTTSQKVMEGYLGYQVIPGHYYGCVPVKT